MIRIATLGDLASMVDIFNQAIEAKFQTAYTEKVSVAARAGWFHDHTEDKFPLFVYEIDGVVVGYASASPYRESRPAFRYCVEVSYFLHHAYLQRGIGTELLRHTLDVCKDLNYKTAIAIILDKNTASTKLLEKFGFEQWGFLPGIADFDGVRCSHVFYGKHIND